MFKLCKLSVFQNNKKLALLSVLIFSIVLGGVFSFQLVIKPYILILRDAEHVPCDQLPDLSQAEKIYNEHLDTVEQIENISPDNVFVLLIERCPGKGEVEIQYDTMSTRKQIKNLIGDTFFGIPYVMFNI